MTTHQLKISELVKNGTLIRNKVPEFEYDHVFVYGHWRMFYTLEGDTAPKNAHDSDHDGIPDYIASMLFKFETARILFCEAYFLDDPTTSGFYFSHGVQYIDVYIQNIPRPKGLVSNRVFDNHYGILENTPFQGKSLLVRIDRDLMAMTSVPMHELFHFFQFNYTQIANLWFMEGIARWSQLIFQNRSIPHYRLPSTQQELDQLFDFAHGAEVFWNRLSDLCAQPNEFSLPISLRDNDLIIGKNRTGIKLIREFLYSLKKHTSLVIEEQPNRNISHDELWSGRERRSDLNNKYIFRALIRAIERTDHKATPEVDLFVELIYPIAFPAKSGKFESAGTQALMGFLELHKLAPVMRSNNTLYSELYDPSSRTLLNDLDLSAAGLDDHSLIALSSVKHIRGNLKVRLHDSFNAMGALNGIESVSGTLSITGRGAKLLPDFNTLKEVGKLEIGDFTTLADISGFNRLNTADSIVIDKNSNLERISGFNALFNIRDTLSISENPALSAISGFSKLAHISEGSLQIVNNPHLESITGLSYLQSVKDTTAIDQCPKLSNIQFLSDLSETTHLLLRKLKLGSAAPLRELFRDRPEFPGSIKILSCPISDLNFMSGVSRVGSSLYISNCSLSDLSGLSELTNVGASFSLNSNKIESLLPLSKLESVNGIIGLAANSLKSLAGLENLNQLRTVKWNGKRSTIFVFDNPDLQDIKALQNITARDNQLIFMKDPDQVFSIKPSANSDFSGNHIQVLDREHGTFLPVNSVCEDSPWRTFELLVQCSSRRMCFLCRNKKYGYAWRQTSLKALSLPASEVDFDCPYGEPWSRYGYVSTSSQPSQLHDKSLTVDEQLVFASRYQDRQSFPSTSWGERIDVVYPYLAQGQESDDELRFSLRSLSNIHEDVNVWVTGDKPSWLNTQEAKHIAHERVSDNPYIDSMHAVKQALEHDDMGNHFILMNDDLYILIPTAVAFLGIPRYFADYTDDLDSFKVVVKYHKLELGDLKALQKRAMPMRNYGLHWPYVFNTDLFLNVYNEFGVDQNPHNMETLYYNSCSELVVPYPGDLLRSNKVVQEGFELHQIPKNVVVLNNKEHGFSQIESLLNQLFPEPCRFES